jgi:hypothetical protein
MFNSSNTKNYDNLEKSNKNCFSQLEISPIEHKTNNPNENLDDFNLNTDFLQTTFLKSRDENHFLSNKEMSQKMDFTTNNFTNFDKFSNSKTKIRAISPNFDKVLNRNQNQKLNPSNFDINRISNNFPVQGNNLKENKNIKYADDCIHSKNYFLNDMASNQNLFNNSNENFLLNKEGSGNLIYSSIYPGCAKENTMEESENYNKTIFNNNINNFKNKICNNKNNFHLNYINNINNNNKNNINYDIQEKIPKKRGRKKKVQVKVILLPDDELSEKVDSVACKIEKKASSLSEREIDNEFEENNNFIKKNKNLKKRGRKMKLKSNREDDIDINIIDNINNISLNEKDINIIDNINNISLNENDINIINNSNNNNSLNENDINIINNTNNNFLNEKYINIFYSINNSFDEKSNHKDEYLNPYEEDKCKTLNKNDFIGKKETLIDKHIEQEKNSSIENDINNELILKLFDNDEHDKEIEKSIDYKEKEISKKTQQILKILNSDVTNNNQSNENFKGNFNISNHSKTNPNFGKKNKLFYKFFYFN